MATFINPIIWLIFSSICLIKAGLHFSITLLQWYNYCNGWTNTVIFPVASTTHCPLFACSTNCNKEQFNCGSWTNAASLDRTHVKYPCSHCTPTCPSWTKHYKGRLGDADPAIFSRWRALKWRDVTWCDEIRTHSFHVVCSLQRVPGSYEILVLIYKKMPYNVIS